MKDNRSEKRLGEIIALLAEEQVEQLLDYAEFLAQRYPAQREVPKPDIIPRPEQESVVKAIKRLSASYPMLDRSKMLNETSVLMTQHVIQGRDAVEVIDELELLFLRHYETLAEREK